MQPAEHAHEMARAQPRGHGIVLGAGMALDQSVTKVTEEMQFAV